jgi:hypothetical protein
MYANIDINKGVFLFKAQYSRLLKKKVNQMGLNPETMLSIAMTSMTLGILIGGFVQIEYLGFSVSDFIEGILVGLALTMNLAYLIQFRRK